MGFAVFLFLFLVTIVICYSSIVSKRFKEEKQSFEHYKKYQEHEDEILFDYAPYFSDKLPPISHIIFFEALMFVSILFVLFILSYPFINKIILLWDCGIFLSIAIGLVGGFFIGQVIWFIRELLAGFIGAFVYQPLFNKK